MMGTVKQGYCGMKSMQHWRRTVNFYNNVVSGEKWDYNMKRGHSGRSPFHSTNLRSGQGRAAGREKWKMFFKWL